MLKSRFWAVAGLFFVLNFSFAAAEEIPGQVVVKFKSGVVSLPAGLRTAAVKAAAVSAASVKALNSRFGVYKFKKLYQDALRIRPDWKQLEDEYILIYAGSGEARQIAAEYKKDSNIVRAEANYRVHAFQVNPNDPDFPQQWALAKISAPQGWVRTTGITSEIIAVLDTGINYNHEDFAGKLDLADAKNYVAGNNDPWDDYGHGTAVSGIIAAATNNAKGIAGLNWNATILPIKVLDNLGGGSITDVNDALAYVTALKSTGSNIVAINMSLGQYNVGSDRYAVENPDGLMDRCQDAYNQGIVLAAAAGNGNVDWNTYPAYYSTVLGVAATDINDRRSVWTGVDAETGMQQASNYGPWVDVSAPGSVIFSTNVNGGYSNPPTVPAVNGTSFSSPHVAALAALIKAIKPSLTAGEVMTRITSTADNIDSLQDTFYRGKLGAGRINVYMALSGLTSVITSPASGEYITGNLNIFGTASGWDFYSFSLEAISANGTIEVNTGTTAIDGAQLGSWQTANFNGQYLLKLTVFAADGNSRSTAVNLVVDNLAPTAEISAPLAGAQVSGAITINGTVEDDTLDHYTLEYGQGALPTSYQVIGTYYLPVSNGALATWETAGLQGPYTLRLRAYDRVGYVGEILRNFTITSSAPSKEVNPVSGLPVTFALPNPFDRLTTSEVSLVYNLDGNFDTTIYLFDLNGTLIWRKTFLAGDNGAKAGGNNPAWDGKNMFQGAVPDGVYFYQITADRKVIGRGKIIVLD